MKIDWRIFCVCLGLTYLLNDWQVWEIPKAGVRVMVAYIDKLAPHKEVKE